jgi:hypothetical protein
MPASLAQEVGDTIGDVALGDAVEGDGHARAGETDERGCYLHRAPVD